jgi:hypothetical protein
MHTKIPSVAFFYQRVRAFFADQVLKIQRCENAEDAGAGKVAAAVAMYASIGEALRLRHGQEGEVPLQQRAVDIVYGTKVAATAKPFIVLDGSSGVGKTQQAFALKGFKVIYMLVHTWEAVKVHHASTFAGVPSKLSTGELHVWTGSLLYFL